MINKDRIISWRLLRNIFFFFLGFLLLLLPALTYNLIKNYNLENLIGTIIFCAFYLFISLFLFLLIYIWKIEIFPDKIIHTGISKKKNTYNFSDIALIQHNKYTEILDRNGKTIIRISFLLNNYGFLLKTYDAWKKNNCPIEITNKTIKYNFYAKNFSIVFLIISILSFVCFLIATITYNSNEIGFSILSIVLSIFTLLIGLYFLLLYKVWTIKIENDSLKFRNIFFKSRIYKLADLSIKRNPNTIDIMHGDKKIIKVFIHYSSNYNIIYDYLRNK